MVKQSKTKKAFKHTMDYIIPEIDHIEYMLNDRLPHQRSHLLEQIVLFKWKNDDNKDSNKNFLLSLQRHQYQAAEQSELLVKLLMRLDEVESNGSKNIKKKRKESVVKIQSLLERSDKFKTKADSLLFFFNSYLKLEEEFEGESSMGKAQMKESSTEEETEEDETEEISSEEEGSTTSNNEELESMSALNINSNSSSKEAEAEISDNEGTSDEENSISQKELEICNQEEPEAEVSSDEKTCNKEEKAQDVDMTEFSNENEKENSDEDEDEEVEEPVESSSTDKKMEKTVEKNSNEQKKSKIQNLPEYEPQHSVYNVQDGLLYVIQAKSLSKENLSIQVDEESGRFNISGYKLPTEHDLLLKQIYGKINYGRFIIRDQVSPFQYDVGNADYEIRDDGLYLYIPHKLSRRNRYPVQNQGYYRYNPFLY